MVDTRFSSCSAFVIAPIYKLGFFLLSVGAGTDLQGPPVEACRGRRQNHRDRLKPEEHRGRKAEARRGQHQALGNG